MRYSCGYAAGIHSRCTPLRREDGGWMGGVWGELVLGGVEVYIFARLAKWGEEEGEMDDC